MKVSKNYETAEEITNWAEIIELANEKKCVGTEQDGFFAYAAAAWVQNWSLRACSKWKFYKLKKIQ